MRYLKLQTILRVLIVVTLAHLPAWVQATPQNQPNNRVEDGQDITGKVSDRPFVFTSNRMLPPMIYLQDNQRVGIIVDLAEALKRHINRPVILKYMDWSLAQQQVLDGKADAVLHINPSEKRMELFDFSDDLLESEFSIFVNQDSEDIYGPKSLKGMRVGVLNKGLCFNLLSQDPLINLVTYPEILPGFVSLSQGGLDAVVMDHQVGTFLLAENNIRGIRIAGDPIDRSASAIAVKKGNAELLVVINRALADIKNSGTYARILAKWEPKEVIFQTREQSRRQKIILLAICAVAGTALTMILLFIAWNRSLKKKVDERTSKLMISKESLEAEIIQRKRMEAALRENRDYLHNLTGSMGDAVFAVKMPERIIEWVNDSFKILGYDPAECIGRSTDFLYPNHRAFLTFGDTLESIIATGRDVVHVEQELKKKSGEVFPAEVTITLHRINRKVVSLTGIVRDIGERKRAEEKLLEYQGRLKALASQLTIVEENERRRIASDLHDDVCQSLALIRIQVSSARKKTLDPALIARLDDISNALRQTLQDTRHLMPDLSSPSMNEIGLSAAISEFLEETVANRYDISIEFNDDIDEHRRGLLEDNVRTILYRNVRELVTNVVKHARATKVNVHLKEELSRFLIVVQDDGVGFNPEKITPQNGRSSGYGLFSIEERMSDLGGTFKIVSEPNKGSTAILSVPLNTGH